MTKDNTQPQDASTEEGKKKFKFNFALGKKHDATQVENAEATVTVEEQPTTASDIQIVESVSEPIMTTEEPTIQEESTNEVAEKPFEVVEAQLPEMTPPENTEETNVNPFTEIPENTEISLDEQMTTQNNPVTDEATQTQDEALANPFADNSAAQTSIEVPEAPTATTEEVEVNPFSGEAPAAETNPFADGPEPIAETPTEEASPAQEEVAVNPFADGPVTEEPVAEATPEPVAMETPAEENALNPFAEVPTEEAAPVQEELAANPFADTPVVEEPVAEATPEPVAMEAPAEENALDPFAEVPTEEETTEQPVAEITEETPAVEVIENDAFAGFGGDDTAASDDSAQTSDDAVANPFASDDTVVSTDDTTTNEVEVTEAPAQTAVAASDPLATLSTIKEQIEGYVQVHLQNVAELEASIKQVQKEKNDRVHELKNQIKEEEKLLREKKKEFQGLISDMQTLTESFDHEKEKEKKTETAEQKPKSNNKKRKKKKQPAKTEE